jgi:hypothetical protein
MSSPNQPTRYVSAAASREAFVEQEFLAGRDRRIENGEAFPAAAAAATAVVAFWQKAGPSMWFAKDADFDNRFREAFLGAHEDAARGRRLAGDA